ncbi:MAG: helix-turn-helix domain-containing protein [bacterium]
MSNLLDIKQTSEILNMKVPTLYRWVHERKIPFVKMGNKLRFKENEILDFIEQNSFSIQ